MTFSSTTHATLPIYDILNANPAWVRGDEGFTDLEALQHSMNSQGLQLPVLLMPDYLMLDGARRVVAAKKLGWKDIPVIIAHDWQTIVDYFVQAAALTEQGWPRKAMTWLELGDLWSINLHQAYHPERSRRASEIQRRLRQGKDAHDGTDPQAVQRYTHDLGVMFGYKFSDIKMLRDLSAAVRNLAQKVSPRDLRQLKKLILTHQEIATDNGARPYSLERTSAMRNRLRDVTGSRATFAEMIAAIVANTEKLRKQQLNRTNPPLEYKRIGKEKRKIEGATGRLVEMIEDLAEQAEHVSDLDTALSADEARYLHHQLVTSIRQLNRLKRHLESVVSNPTNQGDSA